MLPQGMLKLALTLVLIADDAWQFVQDCDLRVGFVMEAHTHTQHCGDANMLCC